MGKITFILGGSRSGKSTYALELAKKHKRSVAFIATGEAKDAEMLQRIQLHKNNRPKHWKTFEESKNIVSLLKKEGNNFECIIIDCLTLLVSNLILAGSSQKSIEDKIHKILTTLKKLKARAIIISNEVGLGIVPKNKLARDFRDIAGRINQIVAGEADEVFFMVSGIPLKLRR